MSENFSPVLTENAGVIARADTGHAPAPGTLAETELLDAMARESASIAADFIWAGNRTAAREHLRAAIQQLNEAEQAAARTIQL